MSPVRSAPWIALCSALTVACGGAPAEKSQTAALADAVQQMTDRVEASGAGSVDPLPAVDLAQRLPEQLVGFAATDRSHQDVGMGGLKMAMATAEYTRGSERIDVSVTDAGGTGKMAPMAAAWAMTDFDRTTSSGYERTIRFEGHKGVEMLSRSGGRLRTELSVLVGDRIILQLKGVGVEMETLKEAASALDVRSLARGA